MKFSSLVKLVKMFSHFTADCRGNFAIIIALMAVPLMGAIGAATDYARLYNQTSHMQELSDAAALAAAAEFGLSTPDEETIKEVAESYVLSFDKSLDVEVEIDEVNQEIQVNLSKYWEPMLIHYVDDTALPIKTAATASRVGSNNLCILALDKSASASLSIEGKASVSAESCAVYSNSSNNKGISLAGGASLKAESICSAGGYTGSINSLKPKPLVDCPLVPDPLVSRAFSTSLHCDYNETIIADSETTLHPGTYCDGVHITDESEVELKPGHYRFLNGPLIVDNHSEISGKYVTLQFSGKNSFLNFTHASTVDLSAMKTGATAGMLIIADKTTDPSAVYKIQSADAKEFTGLVYSPNNKVQIGADPHKGNMCAEGGIHGPDCKHPKPFCKSSFGQFSDWTAIVSKTIKINDGVDLVMNADYAGSDIPVPISIGSGGRIHLVK